MTTTLLAPSRTLARGPGGEDVTLRALEPGDGPEIRRLFRETLVLGRSLPTPHRDLEAYERYCLDWYLHRGRGDSRVVVCAGDVVGYALVCVDQEDYDVWTRLAAARWLAAAAARLATGRLRDPARTFAGHRLSDARRWRRSRPPTPFPAHGHLNLTPAVRGAELARRVAAEVDRIVAAAGLDGWYEDVDVPHGRSVTAFTDAGAEAVHRMRSETFSWLLGVPVDRIRFARPGRGVHGGGDDPQADVHPGSARRQLPAA